jgi:hypothetical protein
MGIIKFAPLQNATILLKRIPQNHVGHNLLCASDTRACDDMIIIIRERIKRKDVEIIRKRIRRKVMVIEDIKKISGPSG